MIGVDLKGFNYLKRNCKIFSSKLTRKNKALEEQIQLVAAGKEVGKRYTVLVKH